MQLASEVKEAETKHLYLQKVKQNYSNISYEFDGKNNRYINMIDHE